jgi:hypothetical protein
MSAPARQRLSRQGPGRQRRPQSAPRAAPVHPAVARLRAAGNRSAAALLARIQRMCEECEEESAEQEAAAPGPLVQRQPVNPADDNKPPGNLGPPLQELPGPPMGGVTYKNGQWYWWGKNLPLPSPLPSNTGDIPLDPRKIPDILKGDQPKRKKADCTPYTTHPYPAGTDALLGQCCSSSIEDPARCCPPERISQQAGCCKPGQIARPDKCEDFTLPPGWMSKLPGFTVPGLGGQGTPAQPPPPPAPLKMDLSAGLVDDFDINSDAINARQEGKVSSVKSAVKAQLSLCPNTWIEIVGSTDKPGNADDNVKLGLKRAERLRLILQLELADVPNTFSGMMLTRSVGAEGATPGGPGKGGEYNSKDRKAEVTLHSLCEPVSSKLTLPPLLGGLGGPGSLLLGPPGGAP